MKDPSKNKDTYLSILENAQKLFATQGFHRTSTRQIARAAGISIQTLHYHCGGKRNLYLTVMENAIVPMFEMLNRHVQQLFTQDLNDDHVLEKAIDQIIDDLFDLIHSNPNLPLLFYRQWIENDQDLRNVEWEKLVPLLLAWAGQIKTEVRQERLKDINFLLLLTSLGWMYWGLFVQPEFISKLIGVDSTSKEYLSLMKAHAKIMTLRMMGQRLKQAASQSKTTVDDN